MNNFKVVIDAGHGGEDPGAVGNGIIEKDLTLAISKEMYNKLKSAGIPVYLTRIDDETLSPSKRTERILNAFGNDPNVIVISNHINAGGGDGAEVIYALRNNSNLANLVLNELVKSGQNIRKAYQRRLPSDTSKDYYFIHRDTGVTEAIIVEYGFLDSSNDDINQLKNNYLDYANAVTNAILNYVGKPISNDTYIVKAGDTLWGIAKKLGVTVDELKKNNNLISNSLNIGQTLLIPNKEILDTSEEYKLYIVKPGDSLYKIASSNNITVKDLMNFNNLTSSNLQINQTLLIPLVKQEENLSEYMTYTVKSGDNLYSIANKYNITVAELRNFNDLNTDILSIGQVLRIPIKDIETEVETSSYIEYYIEPGDTLYSISRKYDISVSELKRYNNLVNDILSIGQIIRIPVSTLEEIYIVKSGDTLYSIAEKYNTTVNDIKNKNNLTNNLLTIGQKLII